MEHSTFTPLAFSATGGMAKQSTTFYKRLASLLAVKWDHSYSSTLSWLQCRISFSLLRSAIQSIRGGHSSPGYALRSTPPVDLAWWTMRHKLAVPEVTFWTHFSSLLVPCISFNFPNPCSTCTYLQVNFYILKKNKSWICSMCNAVRYKRKHTRTVAHIHLVSGARSSSP